MEVKIRVIYNLNAIYTSKKAISSNAKAIATFTLISSKLILFSRLAILAS